MAATEPDDGVIDMDGSGLIPSGCCVVVSGSASADIWK